MKKIKSFILCGLILAAGMFSNNIFASGIDDIRQEFITCCKTFKYNDEVVEKVDNAICCMSKVNEIGEAPLEKVFKYYADLFKKNSGNCRVMSAYFSMRFDSESIENREINGILGQENMHTANLYKIEDKWYVADFTMAIKNPKNAAIFFAIPLEEYVLSCRDENTNKRALAFGVYNKTDRGGMDLGEFIPKIQSLLNTYDFMVYVGPRTDMPICAFPRADMPIGAGPMNDFDSCKIF